ncbi:MAG TPA: hypothetical protein DCG91_02710 [Clostridiales bacterium UBA9857]|nr:hypothetical protein [Clostridiales bacterium UBA9857]
MDTKWRKSEEARPEEEMDTLGIYNGIAEDGHTGEHTNEHTDEALPESAAEPGTEALETDQGQENTQLGLAAKLHDDVTPPSEDTGETQRLGERKYLHDVSVTASPKPRKSRPFAAWLCFVLGMTLISLCTVGAFVGLVWSQGNWESMKSLVTDYKSSLPFKARTSRYFSALFYYITSLTSDIEPGSQSDPASDAENHVLRHSLLDNEGENLKYFAIEIGSGLTIANIDGNLSSVIGEDNMPILPPGYDYCWYFDGKEVWVFDHGKPVDIRRLDSGYRGLVPDPVTDWVRRSGNPDDLASIRVLLAVKNVLVPNPYGYSDYYYEQRTLAIAGRLYFGVLAAGVLMFAYGVIKRRDKHIFDRKLAAWSGRLWFEVKVFLSLLVALVAYGVPYASWDWYPYVHWWSWLPIPVLISAGILLFALFWFYMMLADLIINRKRFFSHNSVNSLLTLYRNYEKKYPWQKMMLSRVYALIIAEAVLCLLAVIFILGFFGGSALLALLSLLLVALGVFLLYRYLRRYSETVNDLGRLVDHIRRIKDGDMETKLLVAADSDIHEAAQNLNTIQEGMSRAVREKLKSERMKVDLITNVSHDLKTPLTSIVSYVELLAKEEGLPPNARDYVAILAQKTERLRHLIQDLFDLAKATSDNIVLDLNKLDLARLINQALADMQESIEDSGLAFRVKLPDEPVYIVSDGAKLSRVLQNLISNTLKYSLLGSRVFIDLEVQGKEALVTIKNTANYEMDFDEEEILERFVRGDRSRSTEGSGLGLSIAKSFTEACGGRFAIKIDGDQFKVELRFQLAG